MCTDVQEPDVRERWCTVPQPLRAARSDVRAADAPRRAPRVCLQRCARSVHACGPRPPVSQSASCLLSCRAIITECQR